MDNKKFLKLAESEASKYVIDNVPLAGVADFDVYVVWSCKTLQNNKALLSSNIEDGLYFEATYNGDKHEMYLDAYKKEHNQAIEVSNVNN